MAKRLDVAIELELDDNGAIKKVTKLNKGIKATGPATDKATAGLGRMKNMIGGIGLAIVAAKIGKFMKDSTDAAAEQQRVFNSLAVGLGNAGVAYNDVGRELQSMFTQLQETTKYGDTDTAQTLQKLVTITGDYDAAMKLLEPTLDFATAMQIDLATAARLTGQAATGMTGTLSRYGIVLDETTTEQIKNADSMERANIMAAELEKRFSGAAAAELQDYAGRVQQVGNYWGDFSEALGDVLVKTAAAPGVFSGLINVFKTLTDFAKDFGEVVVFIGNFDFGKAIQAYAKKAAAAYYRLFAGVYSALKDLPEWLGGGKKAAGMEEALSTAAAILEDMAEIDLTSVFDDANDAALDYRDAVDNVTAASSGPGGLVEAVEDVGTTGQQVFNDLADTVVLTVGRHGPFYAAFAGMRKQAEAELDGVADAAEELADDTDAAFGDMAKSFGDMLGKGFTGEFESFSDLWTEIWKDLAKEMTSILGDAFGSFMDGDGGEGFAAIFDASGKTGGEKLGQFAAGAGGVMAAHEQGGGMGAMAGLLSGAMAGAVFGPIGAAVGGAVGLIAGLMGGKDDPRTGYNYGPGGFQVTSTQGQDLGEGAWAKWEKDMNELVRESQLAYRNLLKMFGDPELFDLVGALGEFTIAGRAGTLEDVSAYIANEWLPFQMDTIFGQAMAKGFGDLGLDTSQIEGVFDQLNLLSGESRINALQDLISALVMFDDALTNFGTGDQLLAFMDRSPMQIFAEDMAEVRGQIDLVTVGWENMSLQDRAREAQEIGVLFQSALQTTLGMLQQIDAVRSSINQSFDRMLEDFKLNNMSDVGKQRFFRGKIAGLTGELADATDADEIARISAEIQRYIQSLAGIVDLEATGSFTNGLSWNDYLATLTQAAKDAANAQLAEIEEEVLGEYDALIEKMREAEEALTGFTAATTGATGTGTAPGGAPGDPNPIDSDPKSTTVNVTVGGEMAPLINLIYSIVDDRVAGPGSIE
ncbi:MAG: hypothetical protein DRJ50_02590 [Actinobacteria bacterium]|nr:MAG: hypothetical protein DRJ50_02590 [Actinomycetota bacterium]